MGSTVLEGNPALRSVAGMENLESPLQNSWIELNQALLTRRTIKWKILGGGRGPIQKKPCPGGGGKDDKSRNPPPFPLLPFLPNQIDSSENKGKVYILYSGKGRVEKLPMKTSPSIKKGRVSQTKPRSRKAQKLMSEPENRKGF